MQKKLRKGYTSPVLFIGKINQKKKPFNPEPWKEYNVYNQYIGYFCIGVNSIIDGKNTFLTCFITAIKYEGYNIGDTKKYPLENWLYLLKTWMDNKGEMVDASMNLYKYKCNLQAGINRNILIDKKNIPSKPVSTWKSISKGKKLHDEIFLDKKISLLDYIREMDFEGDTSLRQFYNRTAAYLREASILNRISDISYTFFLENMDDEVLQDLILNKPKKPKKEDDNILDVITGAAGVSAANDYPILTEIIKNEKFQKIKKAQAVFGYVFDDIFGAKSFLEKMENYRGPFLLEPISIEKNNAGNIFSYIDDEPDTILYDLQLLKKINIKS